MAGPLNTTTPTESVDLTVHLDPSYLYIALLSYLFITFIAVIVAAFVFLINYHFKRQARAAVRAPEKDLLNDDESDEQSESDSDDEGFIEEETDEESVNGNKVDFSKTHMQKTQSKETSSEETPPFLTESPSESMFGADRSENVRASKNGLLQVNGIEDSPVSEIPAIVSGGDDGFFVESDYY